MDTTDTTTDPTVSLPGACAKVYLPRQVNFLRTTHGGHVGIGQLSKPDAALLAIAHARALLEHHRRRYVDDHRLAPVEAQHVDVASLAHPAIVERVARALSERHSKPFAQLNPYAKEAACDNAGFVIRTFLEELFRE